MRNLLSDESSIHFYSTSNGYNKRKLYSRRPRLSATRYLVKCTGSRECEGDRNIQVAKRLFPRLHTLFAYTLLINGPNLNIFPI